MNKFKIGDKVKLAPAEWAPESEYMKRLGQIATIIREASGAFGFIKFKFEDGYEMVAIECELLPVT